MSNCLYKTVNEIIKAVRVNGGSQRPYRRKSLALYSFI